MTKNKPEYRKDILGDLDKETIQANPLIPASTVVLLRTLNGAPEVLMLQKNTGISFGGMWVFPGGKIDKSDYDNSNDIQIAAKNASIRETKEETGLTISSDEFIQFAHWTPPPSTPKRFSTWFYAVVVEEAEDVTIDGGEITNHRWVTPTKALEHHLNKEIELAPPTWITLYQLSLRKTANDIMGHFQNQKPMSFETQLMFNDNKAPMAIWEGDSAYGSKDPNLGSERHRLIMTKEGFIFENTIVDY